MKESIDRQARELDPIKTECIQNKSEKKRNERENMSNMYWKNNKYKCRQRRNWIIKGWYNWFEM